MGTLISRIMFIMRNNTCDEINNYEALLRYIECHPIICRLMWLVEFVTECLVIHVYV